jgi:hypothetical protein
MVYASTTWACSFSKHINRPQVLQKSRFENGGRSSLFSAQQTTTSRVNLESFQENFIKFQETGLLGSVITITY